MILIPFCGVIRELMPLDGVSVSGVYRYQLLLGVVGGDLITF